VPERAAGERENRRYRLFEAVAGLLGQAAAARPLLLLIEDLQWAGRPTLLLLRHVVRRLHGAPVLVLVTLRDAEADPGGASARLLADLSREEVVQRVALAGLDEAETADLVGDPALARTLQDRTAGNPFFIEEMLRSLAEAPEEPPGLPESVKDLVSRRLARLAPDTVETLTAAAVLGRDFRLDTLAAMAGRPGEALLAPLEEALRAGVVREDAAQVDHFTFGHALVRETLYDAPAASRRARLHLRAGEALAAAGAPPGELAYHFFAAREVGGAEAAVAHGTEAARRAVAAHAYEEAAWHLEQSLVALGPDDPLTRAELLIALGDVRWQASEPGARAAFDEAAELARRHAAPEALARAVLGAGGRLYMPTARDTAYVGRLEEALAALGDHEGPLRARLLARLAEHLALADAGDRPQQLGAEAVAMARRASDDGALAAALLGHHAALLDIDHVEARRELIDEALATAGRLAADELVALALHWRIYDLMELGDVEEAARSYERLHALAHELHQPLYSHATLAWRGVAAQLDGHFDEAERIARESLRIAEAAGAPEARAFFLTQLFAVRREQGRLAELVDPLERLSRLAGPVGVSWRSTLPFILVEAEEPERARAAYAAVAGDDFAALPTSLFRLTGLICLAEACAALGDAAGAASLHARLEPHADRLVQTGFSGCWGSVRRFLGLLAATAGRPDQARAHFEAALARHRELEAPGLVARTQCDLGELLLAQGERDAGRSLLAAAGAAAAELGMAGIAARADVSRAELGAL
jgi:tetratricopeptide (TPR) repeat protein